jgi:hypothetical protein
MVAGPSALDAAGERLLHPSAEVRRVDPREAEWLRLDLLEMREGAGGIDQPARDHLSSVAEIVLVRALELAERLRIRSKW